MKVYLAGASLEADRVSLNMRALEQKGIVITHDWTVQVKKAFAEGQTLADIGVETVTDLACADYRGVIEADYLWVMVPDKPSTGCWAELGIALGARMMPGSRARVLVSGDRDKCIFAYLAEVRMPTHEEAFEFLVQESKR